MGKITTSICSLLRREEPFPSQTQPMQTDNNTASVMQHIMPTVGFVTVKDATRRARFASAKPVTQKIKLEQRSFSGLGAFTPRQVFPARGYDHQCRKLEWECGGVASQDSQYDSGRRSSECYAVEASSKSLDISQRQK